MKKTSLFKCLVAMGILLGTTAAANAQGPWDCGLPISGTTPTNAVTATLSGTSPNYTLTISGIGAMRDYFYTSSFYTSAPWGEYYSRMTSVVIEQGVTTIGTYAFYNCTSLASVTIPSSVTTIGSAAFYGCTSLGTVTIPSSGTTIGEHAFAGCTSLGKVINESATPQNISSSTFTSARAADLYVPADALVAYQTADYWKDFHRIVAIGTTPAPITWNCGMPTVTDVTATLAGDGTMTISGTGQMSNYSGSTVPWSSYRTRITSVVIGQDVTTIGSSAFRGCASLTSVYSLRTTPGGVASDAFYNVNVSSIPLYVPSSAISAYGAANVWKDFSPIKAIYTVTFNSSSGSSVASQSVGDGNKATQPQDPTRSGYTFDGWYKETALTNLWDFNTDVVTFDVTLYAKWIINYTVTFNSVGGNAVPQIETTSGRVMTQLPETPTRSGYILDGWYTNDSYTNQWNFATDIVTQDFTLYAKWTAGYTVTFNAQGGTEVATQGVATGTKIAQPANPSKEGYNFGGWYKEAACTNAWNFNTDVVTAAVTLYAKWIEIVAVTGVSLNKSTTTLAVGGAETLTATITPTTATNKAVTWSSSAPSIASVDSTGKVTAKAVGTATITVTTQDGSKTATCAVTVSAASVVVTGVTLSPTTLSLAPAATQQLTATITPSNATNQNVTWASSNTSVATVAADGRVTAKAAGTATITVTTQDGSKTATCTVTVSTTGGNGDDGTDPATAVATQNVSSLFVYPNPVSDQITVSSDQWNDVGAGSARPSIEIYNVAGTKVFETPLSIVHYPLSINIGHLPAGIYIVRVGNKVAKVVKQ